MIFTAILPQCGGGEKPAAPVIRVESAEADAGLDTLLAPRKYGWLGADGAYTVKLREDRVLWIFMDTFIGGLSADGERRAKMINNSIAVQDLTRSGPERVRFYWHGSGQKPESFFAPPQDSPGTWLWPFSAVVLDGRLCIFGVSVSRTGGDGPFAFDTGEAVVITVSNPLSAPTEWECRVQRLGFGGKEGHFVSAAWHEGAFVYLLGVADTAEKKSAAVLSRVRTSDLKADRGGSAFEFWSEGERGGVWKRSRDSLRPLFAPGASEGSLYRDDSLGCFVAVVQPGLSGDICVAAADRLTGPWSDPVSVYRLPPGRKDDFSYAGKAHPELSGPGEMVFTYATNSFRFERLMEDSSIYYPRFVRARVAVGRSQAEP